MEIVNRVGVGAAGRRGTPRASPERFAGRCMAGWRACSLKGAGQLPEIVRQSVFAPYTMVNGDDGEPERVERHGRPQPLPWKPVTGGRSQCSVPVECWQGRRAQPNVTPVIGGVVSCQWSWSRASRVVARSAAEPPMTRARALHGAVVRQVNGRDCSERNRRRGSQPVGISGQPIAASPG